MSVNDYVLEINLQVFSGDHTINASTACFVTYGTSLRVYNPDSCSYKIVSFDDGIISKIDPLLKSWLPYKCNYRLSCHRLPNTSKYYCSTSSSDIVRELVNLLLGSALCRLQITPFINSSFNFE